VNDQDLKTFSIFGWFTWAMGGLTTLSGSDLAGVLVAFGGLVTVCLSQYAKYRKDVQAAITEAATVAHKQAIELLDAQAKSRHDELEDKLESAMHELETLQAKVGVCPFRQEDGSARCEGYLSPLPADVK
jgi:hypothetical protein